MLSNTTSAGEHSTSISSGVLSLPNDDASAFSSLSGRERKLRLHFESNVVVGMAPLHMPHGSGATTAAGSFLNILLACFNDPGK